jgi:DNA-directed RNA polymerase specialized sigma24 family protein
MRLDGQNQNDLEIMLEVILELPSRYRYFLWLDLVELLSPQEIRERLGLKSMRTFRQLKFEAFSALRRMLEERD